MPLWLVRHARAELPAGTCYGWLDVPAVDTGTVDVARRLARDLPPGTTVWTSPLLRCQQLALALNSLRPDLVPQSHIGLMEAGFGGWEGQLWEQLGPSAVGGWADDLWGMRPGGGECLREVMARVRPLWRQAWQNPRRPQVWLTHAGVLRVARLLWAGVEEPVTAAMWPRDPLPFGAVIRLSAARGHWPA